MGESTGTDTGPTPAQPVPPATTEASRTPHPTPSPGQPPIPIPSSGRYRPPVRPSPLSRIQIEPASSASASESSSPPPEFSKSPKSTIPESSPCFIHSHLDRHGSSQDWLKHKAGPQSHPPHPEHGAHGHTHHSGGSHGPSPVRASSHRHLRPAPLPHFPHMSQPSHHYHPQPLSASHSPPDSKLSSPTGGRGSGSAGRETPVAGYAASGYDSDRSSPPDGNVDGDSVDDDEEGGSSTKQLAETAQGVREMSKESGRTRVRSRIQHVLIVTKARDNRSIKLTRELALYLMSKKPAAADAPSRPGSNERGMVVYVDAQSRTSKRFDAAGSQKEYPHSFEPVGRRRSSSTTSVNTLSAYPSSASSNEAGKRRDEGQLRFWTGEMCSNSPHSFDFVVTLGGDGTVSFTSWLFQRIVPPVLPFALGSLGFLTNFDFANYKSTMDKVIDDGIRVNSRMRFTCTVYRAIAPEEAARADAKGKGRKAIKKPGGEILMSQVDRSGWEALEGSSNQPNPDAPGRKDKEIMCFSTRPVEQFEVLNDLVVDRGPSPFVSLLESFGDEHHLTTVQADGLTVSTPTGSTAYSLSAGGSSVHPQIPAILITPICPHTLSFRPMLSPDSMESRICVPYNSRSTAWASFDGRGRVESKQGDHIKVTASKYPFPTVCADKASTDWFNSISRTLRWNEREKQKSFVVVEEDNEPAGVPKGEKAKDYRRIKMEELSGGAQPERVKEEEEEEDEDEDFDIDDKSGGESTNPSSPLTKPVDPIAPSLARLDSGRHHKSGVDSPDRFVTHCNAPPPSSQRHSVEALAAAEIQSKEGEVGQRDEIRSGPGTSRVDGTHSIPPGRSALSPPHVRGDGDRGQGASPDGHHGPSGDVKTPKARAHFASHERGAKKKDAVCRAKAFAFFGQDDSASDMSDEASEC